MDPIIEQKLFNELRFTVSVGDSSKNWVTREFSERTQAEQSFAQELWNLVAQGARIVPSRMPRKKVRANQLLWRRVLVHHHNTQVKLELFEQQQSGPEASAHPSAAQTADG
jgi:hypothetical protein